jgi:hypothetical protein
MELAARGRRQQQVPGLAIRAVTVAPRPAGRRVGILLDQLAGTGCSGDSRLEGGATYERYLRAKMKNPPEQEGLSDLLLTLYQASEGKPDIREIEISALLSATYLQLCTLSLLTESG